MVAIAIERTDGGAAGGGELRIALVTALAALHPDAPTPPHIAAEAQA